MLFKKCPRPVSLASITAPETEGDIHSPPPGMGFLCSSTKGTAHGLGTGVVTWSCGSRDTPESQQLYPKTVARTHFLGTDGSRKIPTPAAHTLLWIKRLLHFLKKIFCNQIEIYVLTKKKNVESGTLKNSYFPRTVLKTQENFNCNQENHTESFRIMIRTSREDGSPMSPWKPGQSMWAT